MMALYRIEHKDAGGQQPTIHIRAVNLAAITAEVAKRFPDSTVEVSTDCSQAVVRSKREVFTLSEV